MEEFEKITIQRCPHDAENPYVQVARKIARDKSLSPAQIGLITYLLANSERFTINVKTIINQFKSTMSKDAVYRLIKEVIAAGYLKREDVTGSGGKGKIQRKTYRYYLSESANFKESFRNPENQDVEDYRSCKIRGLEKCDYKKEQSSSYEEEKKEEGGKPPTPPPPSLFFEQGQVKMEQSRYDELVKEFGDAKVKETVEDLDAYSQTKPKKFKEYGCHAAVVRNWIKREAKEKGSKVSAQQSSIDADAKLTLEIKKRFPQSFAFGSGNMDSGSNYIEFRSNANNGGLHFKFGEAGFRDKVINQLRKMKLSVEGL